MRTYKVTTVKGIVECYEQNGCYYPVNSKDFGFLFEPILGIERDEEECQVQGV